MRRARLKVPADAPVGYYHCLSRVVDRQFILHEAEKDQFVSLMRQGVPLDLKGRRGAVAGGRGSLGGPGGSRG